MATITGTGNGETINATNDADVIEGGAGDDVINGLGGDDVITDAEGSDTIDGGAGNDRITIDRPYWVITGAMHISGGDGDDYVEFNVPYEIDPLHIDLGAGDDHVLLRNAPINSTFVTLGGGVDTIELAAGEQLGARYILDFTPGSGGDIVDLATYLDVTFSSWDPTSNPFGDGTISLVQQGTQTVLRTGFANLGGTPILIFSNTTVSQFTAANFSGFDPTGATPGVTLSGTAGADTLVGAGGDDTLSGLAGNDTLLGNAQTDTLRGGTGDDRLEGGRGDDVLYGDAGNDTLIDGAGDSTLHGGDGDDSFEVVYFDSAIPFHPFVNVDGGAGNDTLLIGSSDDCRLVADMGAGNDRIRFDQSTNSATLTLGLGSDVVSLYEYLGPFPNPIIFTDFATGAGGDRFEFAQMAGHFAPEPESAANPFAYGYVSLAQAGADTTLIMQGYTIAIFRNTTAASFTAANFDADPDAPPQPGKTITGTSGADLLNGTIRSDVIDGLGGNDVIVGGGAWTIVGVAFGGDQLSGGDGNDDITGTNGADILDGGNGADRIYGGGAADLITAGAGDDTITYSDSLDTIDGGGGSDTLDFSGIAPGSGGNAAMALDINLTGFAATGVFQMGGRNVTGIESLFMLVSGTAGGDTVDFDAAATAGVSFDVGFGDDRLYGTAGNDSLVGGEGNDLLDGRAGDDYLEGGGNDDHLLGGTGVDNLIGWYGNDVLEGGDGADELWGHFGDDESRGGGGNDTINDTEGNNLVFGGSGDDQINARGTLHGDQGNDTITGSGSADALYGDDGNDVLDGLGGGDTMAGGFGNDLYFADHAGDAISELAGQGIDTLAVDVSFALADSQSIEHLRAFDPNATTVLSLTGNAGVNSITGNAGINVLDGRGGADTMAGLGADDRYTVDNAGDVVIEGAGEGVFDRIFTTVSYVQGTGVHVEALTIVDAAGTAAINLTGNELANFIGGNAGANVLDGKGGADTLVGLGGDDWYHVDHAADVVVEGSADGAFDRIFASASYTQGAGVHVEALTIADAAGSAAINLGGNELANFIGGNAGSNVIDGGANADTMIGLGGDDWYYVDNAGDVVIEGAGQGSFDRIFASASYTLATGVHVEALNIADGTGIVAIDLTGNDMANFIGGNAGANTLSGGAGDDALIGLGGDDRLVGGIGADTMVGGTGDDWYYVDHAGDAVTEGAAEGSFDRIFVGASYALGAGVHIEALTIGDSEGTTAINLIGNELANFIGGNAGTNVIDGGANADTMIGLRGDDWYFVDDAGDVVIEAAADGAFDRIFARASYTQGAGVHVEALTIGDSEGTAEINLTGNELANFIGGNAGDNELDGGAGDDTLIGLGGNDVLEGGGGVDTAIGGLGDDWYDVDNAGDVVIEAAGEGSFDSIFASVSYTLGAGVHVELLTTVNADDTAAINLTGNELGNFVGGNLGANVLDGKGGSDTLVGLGGQDTFVFTTTLGAGNVDEIGDFVVADDTIQLDDAVFTGLATGALAAGSFVTGSAAADADDRVVYDSATGALWFDADGNGAGAAMQFATLGTGLALTSADFLVI